MSLSQQAIRTLQSILTQVNFDVETYKTVRYRLEAKLGLTEDALKPHRLTINDYIRSFLQSGQPAHHSTSSQSHHISDDGRAEVKEVEYIAPEHDQQPMSGEEDVSASEQEEQKEQSRQKAQIKKRRVGRDEEETRTVGKKKRKQVSKAADSPSSRRKKKSSAEKKPRGKGRKRASSCSDDSSSGSDSSSSSFSSASSSSSSGKSHSRSRVSKGDSHAASSKSAHLAKLKQLARIMGVSLVFRPVPLKDMSTQEAIEKLQRAFKKKGIDCSPKMLTKEGLEKAKLKRELLDLGIDADSDVERDSPPARPVRSVRARNPVSYANMESCSEEELLMDEESGEEEKEPEPATNEASSPANSPHHSPTPRKSSSHSISPSSPTRTVSAHTNGHIGVIEESDDDNDIQEGAEPVDMDMGDVDDVRVSKKKRRRIEVSEEEAEEETQQQEVEYEEIPEEEEEEEPSESEYEPSSED